MLSEVEMNFGKHKNVDHTKVPVDYLRWAMENASRAMTPELRKAIQDHLNTPAQGDIVDRWRDANRNHEAKPAPAPKPWVAATVKIEINGLAVGEKIALMQRQRPIGDWDFYSLQNSNSGTLQNANIQNLVVSIKGPDNLPITGGSVEELKKMFNLSDNQPSPEAPDGRHAAEDNNLLYPARKYKMLPEQMKIDEKFKANMESDGQSHIMINALAGSGKTTILKHLAWKYGNAQQKWLYLVFNTKNKVEAKDAFPPWVEVKTTNGFLGEVLGSRANKGRIKQTDRIADLSEDGGGKIEKIREIADGNKFGGFMTTWGLPDAEAAADHHSVPTKNRKTIVSLFKSMRYAFKEEVIKLVNLAKSFAIDQRKPEQATKTLDEIFSKYDMDTEMSDIKDRIQKYSPSFSDLILEIMEEVLGYDFMAKDYKEEMSQAAKWLLHETMPHVSDHKFFRKAKSYSLGSYRDFNDDLWFAATHADELSWPQYSFVLADEVQDFNEAQKIMLKKLHQAGAKIVAVGDPNQSIYRFRGADGKSFNNLSKSLSDWSNDKNVEATLTNNMRSRKAIIDHVNKVTHVGNLKQGKKFSDNHDGTVTDKDMKYDEAFDILQKESRSGRITKSTAFLARTNEPLTHAALRLLSSGVPFIIVGKDIAKDLVKHMGKVSAMNGLNDYSSIHDVAQKLSDHNAEEKDRHEGVSAKRSHLQELEEVTGALTAAVDSFLKEQGDHNQQKLTLGVFKRWLTDKLGGLNIEDSNKDLDAYKAKLEQNAVVLTTAHRSKGLEFHRVFILRDDQFPHPRAKREEDLEQEANAKYVAYTRAMDELHILELDGQPGYVKDKEGEGNVN